MALGFQAPNIPTQSKQIHEMELKYIHKGMDVCVCVEQRHVLGMKINSHPKMRKGTLHQLSILIKNRNTSRKKLVIQ